MEATCFGCEHKNPSDHVFCSSCGSPLALSSYVGRQVDARLAEATKDREYVELESSVRIFTQAYGWAKLVGGIAAGVVALLIAGAAWESFNLRTAVKSSEAAVEAARSSAETSISNTAQTARDAMTQGSSSSLQEIRTAASRATKSSDAAQTVAKTQSREISIQAEGLRKDFQSQAATVTKDVASARQQIQAASQLQPQMTLLQQQLATAQTQIQDQQRVLTSSADFVKKIFASHMQFLFNKKTADPATFAILPTAKIKDVPDSVAVYFLLPSTPIAGTVEVQFNQIPAAPGSFFTFHNLLVTFIQPQAQDELLGKPVSVNFFPDPDDKEQMHSLTIKDGRVYADGEALIKFGTMDDSFKGSKWFLVAPIAPPPSTPPPTPNPLPKHL